VTKRKRLLLSLLVSIVIAVLLVIAGQMSHSKGLLVAQMPGLGAFAMIWGIHSSFTPVAWAVWIAANALVYWPIIFALSFLIRNKPSP
jgi:hypothetical protein